VESGEGHGNEPAERGDQGSEMGESGGEHKAESEPND
jgi:hypothetical protein